MEDQNINEQVGKIVDKADSKRQIQGLVISPSHIPIRGQFGEFVGLGFTRSSPESWKIGLAKIRQQMYLACLSKGINIEADNFVLVTVCLPCGCEIPYKRFKNIPKEDTKCECGRCWVVKYIEKIPCASCQGTGKSKDTASVECPECGGTGIEKQSHSIKDR